MKMRDTLTAWLAACFLCLTGMAWAQAPEPPEVAARAYLLVDLTANQVLVAKGADQPLEPASLTKLMSAYLVFDALKSKPSRSARGLGKCLVLACSSTPR
jgi:D-alanyl-D-alanine carboxypeptidase (penicillin-binding protein 5/6)